VQSGETVISLKRKCK